MYPPVKRISDILAALIGLAILSPAFIVLSIIIKTSSKGKVFFAQKRIGKKKKHFYMYKFRTMRSDAPKDVPTHLLENPEAHITKIGKFLRKTSLDELPQLINVLRGDMSLVGPRPALWNQYDLIALRDRYKANNIRPGLTGLAQVKGRDELPIPIKAKYDGEYVQKMSLILDLKILLGTAASVSKGDGVKEGAG